MRKFFMCFTLIILLANSAMQANAEVLFEDNFDDGVADGWNEVLGTWSVINGEYICESYDDCRSFTGNFTWSNYVYEAKIRMDKITNDFGLIFYAQSPNDYLRCTISNGEQGTGDLLRISHVKDEADEPDELATFTRRIKIIDGKWYKIKLILNGNRVFVIIDNKFVAYANNLPFASGAIGLAADDATTYFDDVLVTVH